MTEPGSCGRRVVDDDDEIERLLAGVELPHVESDAPHDGLGPPLADLEELGGLSA